MEESEDKNKNETGTGEENVPEEKSKLRPIRGELKEAPIRPKEGETKEEQYAKMDYCLKVAATYYNVPSTRSLPPSEVSKLQRVGRFLYWYLDNFEWLNAGHLLEGKKIESKIVKMEDYDQDKTK